MPKSLAEYLRGLADQIESDEKAEMSERREAELRERLERVEAQGVSDDDRAVVARARELLAELDAEDDAERKRGEKKKPAAKADADKPADDKKAADDDKPAKDKTRPGRKNGMAYSWWVDDDGQVVKLDTARIYSGPDEDDEVTIPDKPAEATA